MKSWVLLSFLFLCLHFVGCASQGHHRHDSPHAISPPHNPYHDVGVREIFGR